MEATGVSIVLDSKGNGVAFWNIGPASPANPNGFQSASRYYVSTNTWDPPEVIQPVNKYASGLDPVVDPAGNITVMTKLSDINDIEGRIAAIRFTACTKQRGVTQNLTGTPCIANAAGRTVDHYGNLVAVLTDLTRFADEQSNDRYFRRGVVRYNAATEKWSAVHWTSREMLEECLVSVEVDVSSNVQAYRMTVSR